MPAPGNTTCIVGDGTVGVDGHRDTDRGEHAHGTDADAVKTGEVVAETNGGNDADHR